MGPPPRRAAPNCDDDSDAADSERVPDLLLFGARAPPTPERARDVLEQAGLTERSGSA
jgi:hypothetical protein